MLTSRHNSGKSLLENNLELSCHPIILKANCPHPLGFREHLLPPQGAHLPKTFKIIPPNHTVKNIKGSQMEDYQEEFIEFLVQTGALRFGEFRLKSDRISPYFFDAGQFNSGEDVDRLGYFYASAFQELRNEVTIVFGPAYKGIPICVSTAIALKRSFNVSSYYSFNRKEHKSHGEGGWVVGRIPTEEDKIVIVDDVITEGTTKIETIQRLRDTSSAEILGLIVALDRKARKPDGESASRTLAQTTGIEVQSIVTIYEVVDYLAARSINGKEKHLSNVQDYLQRYGET